MSKSNTGVRESMYLSISNPFHFQSASLSDYEIKSGPSLRGGTKKRKNQFQFSKSVSRLRS